MRTFRISFACLLFVAGIALAQSNPPAPALKPRPNSTDSTTGEASKVAPDAAVITVQGLCEKPATASAPSSDCKTVISRAEFEKIVNAVQPNMPPSAKKQFANRYVTVLLLAQKAHELGVDHGPDFDEQLYLSRLQILSRLAGERLQKEATVVSDSEVEDYYRQHIADYKTITFDRLYVPRQKQVNPVPQKAAPAKIEEKKTEDSEGVMKVEADKLRARAAAGEDFTKLQQEAYDFAGSKQKAANPRTENARKNVIPPTDIGIFDLKKDEVSQVFSDPSGFMIYKVIEVKDLPVAGVHDEIARTLQSEKMKSAIDALQNSAKTTLDEDYFATPAPPAAPSLRKPGELPVMPPPAPGKK